MDLPTMEQINKRQKYPIETDNPLTDVTPTHIYNTASASQPRLLKRRRPDWNKENEGSDV